VPFRNSRREYAAMNTPFVGSVRIGPLSPPASLPSTRRDVVVCAGRRGRVQAMYRGKVVDFVEE